MSDVQPTHTPQLIDASIVVDLSPAQGTPAIVKNGRLIWLYHADASVKGYHNVDDIVFKIMSKWCEGQWFMRGSLEPSRLGVTTGNATHLELEIP
ncbi:MAG: hypothetical protein OES26_14100 [Gammaproteobacteria bacterium]|nr:hypothetical protein [Gammaproteobacteria bacterium]